MLNKVTLIGRVGKDPEIKYTGAGKAIANFSIATSESYKDKQTGEKVEKTEWHNISAFDRLAEVIGEYVKKGALLYVEGKIQTRKYEKDGVERYATSILINEMKMLGGRSEGDNQQSQQRRAAPAAQPQGGGFDDMDDDIPF
jgi:single-strand DNA-binding protein